MPGTFQVLSVAATLAAISNPSFAVQTEALREVTVTTKHLQLEQRVSRFVYQIAALQNAEGLPRWRQGVCPQVMGLPQAEGEFILERISQISRTAQAPLAAQHCRSNLFIVVTEDPKVFWRG